MSEVDYFDIDFSNMRFSFSLFASQHCCAACAADRAWLAEFCADFKLPFDLMIGVNRSVYRGGVFQGQDLYDSRVSLIDYAELFNAFPQVTFPISVLASVTNQELVSYAWIFPNVVTNGHWWADAAPGDGSRSAGGAGALGDPGCDHLGHIDTTLSLEGGELVVRVEIAGAAVGDPIMESMWLQAVARQLKHLARSLISSVQ